VENHPTNSDSVSGGLALVVHCGLVCAIFFPVNLGGVLGSGRTRFAYCLRTGDKWRKTFEEFIKHLAAREKLLNRNANLDTIIAGLFKGAIVAVGGHFF
jgi:hypothetical protein